MKRKNKNIGDKFIATHKEKDTFLEREFTVNKILGEGATCVVYLVEYMENNKYIHKGVLKEFNPVIKEITKEKFLEGYRKQCEFSAKVEAGVNITSRGEGIYVAGEDTYILMGLDQGTSYGEIEEESIFTTIKTCIGISKAIEAYHKEGLLHLDIKPDNIFILNETRELVKLFDFDSVQKLENIMECRLSYSEEWAAPELIYGEKNKKISYGTDIYAIGMIMFYKILERFPRLEEKERFAEIDFNREAGIFKGISPKIFENLNNFFRKTINLNIKKRFKSIEETIESLNILLDITRPEKKALIDSRWHKEEKSLGRIEEMKKIDAILKEKNSVFIKAVGGLGKSELVKMYVDEYKKEYTTIQFLGFQESIENTIAQGLQFTNFNEEDYRDQKKLFLEKLKLLNNEDSTTLIVIDNFNVNYDKDLDSLISNKENRYKVIFTTRNENEDFSEYYFNLEPLREEECLDLYFKFYGNKRRIRDIDKGVISEIIKTIGYNTLVIKLIALNCQKQRVNPKEILKKLKECKLKEIGGKVRHSIEGEEENNSLIYEHLSKVFDISALKKNSKIILKTLSLIEQRKIDARTFLEWNNYRDFDDINDLISLGWIELDEYRDMISMHEVISTLINEKLKPKDSECISFIKALTRNLKAKNEVRKKEKLYLEFSKDVIKRLDIESDIGADLLIEIILRERVVNKDILEKVKRIYRDNIKGLSKVDYIYIKMYLEKIDSIEYYDNYNWILEKIDYYEREYLKKIAKISEKKQWYKWLRKLYLNKIGLVMVLEESEAKEYAEKIEKLFLLEEKEIRIREDKEKFYREMVDFYGDYMNPLKNDEKREIYDLKLEDKLDDIQLFNLGETAELEENYEMAIYYYKEAIEISKCFVREEANNRVLKIYLEMAKYREIIEWVETSDLEKKILGESYYILGEAYINLKDYNKARKSFKESIEAYAKAKSQEQYSKEYCEDMQAMGYMKLGELSKDKKEGLELYLKAKRLSNSYINNLNKVLGDKTGKRGYYIEELKHIEEEIFSDFKVVQEIEDRLEVIFPEEYLMLGNIYSKDNNIEKAVKLYKEGMGKTKDYILKNRFLKAIGDCYTSDMEQYNKGEEYYNQCDFLAIAKNNIERIEIKREFLIEAGESYNRIEKYRESIECYKEALEIQEDKTKDISSRRLIYNEIANNYLKLENREKGIEYKLKVLRLEDSEKERLYGYIEIGDLYTVNKKDEAIEFYKKALEKAIELSEINVEVDILESLIKLLDNNEEYIERLKDIVNSEIQ